MFLTRKECAEHFGCSTDTIDRRIKKMRQYRIYDKYLFIDSLVRVDPDAMLHFAKYKYLLEHGCVVPSAERWKE